VGVYFDILLPFCVHSEICVFQAYRPPSWIFHFRSIPAVDSVRLVVPILGKMSVKMGVAVEIMSLSYSS
jgi:hypothetical protein